MRGGFFLSIGFRFSIIFRQIIGDLDRRGNFCPPPIQNRVNVYCERAPPRLISLNVDLQRFLDIVSYTASDHDERTHEKNGERNEFAERQVQDSGNSGETASDYDFL